MNTHYVNLVGFSDFSAFSNKCKEEKAFITQTPTTPKSFFKKSVLLLLNTFLLAVALVPLQMNGQSTSTVFNTAGTFTWTAPAGVTSINVQLWGGGGGGAATGVTNGSGGGGGGAFTVSTIAVIPGTTYTLQVGAGGAKGVGCATPTDGTDGTNSWFNDSTTLYANAGKGGKAPLAAAGIGGLGGAASAGAGITSYFGGDGSVGGTSIVLGPGGGGGGGSSAGTSANGVNGSPAVVTAAQTLGGGGGIAPPGGGYGGQGGGYNNMNGLLTGVDGAVPGGGGGGAGNGSNPSCIGLNTDGGNGGHGRVIITTGQTIFTQTGSWTAPACISSVIVEVWAGGGAGGGNETVDDGGGGGGGGAYSKSTVSVTPGQTYAVTVGTGGVGVAGAIGTNGGDSWFINATTILAKGGTGGNPPIAGAAGIPGLGGLASAGIGTTKFNGGNGGPGNDAPVGFGGGGGSSAGYTADGTVGGDANALATVIIPAPGGVAPNGGGDGGDGQNTLLSGNGYSGFTPGGGGGGSSDIEIAPGVSGGAGAGGKIILSYPNPSLVIGNNPVPATDVCANSVNVPIHGFTLTGANGCSTETDIRFTTTGTYTASEILNYKLYYTTTNVFATTNYLVTVSTSTGVGTHSFPSISRIPGGPIYYWITMDVAPNVVDGHTLGVNGTTPADITATPTATGSSTPSGTQTLKSAPVLNSTLTPADICSGATFTYTPTSIASNPTFAWTRATVAGITEAGTSGSGNISETLTNTTASPLNVTYIYITTSSTTNCNSTGNTDSVIVTVNPKPQGSISGNTICGADPLDIGQLTWVSTAGTGPYTLIYNPGTVTESGVVSATSFSVTPNPAATTTYTITSVTDANGCQRTSGFTRDTASINVTSAPIVITSNPTDSLVCEGENASFTVSGTGIYSYGWEVSTNNGGVWTDVTIAAGAQPTYSNATTPTLNLSATTTAHSGYVYRAVLSPACGAVVTTSGTATLTVNPLPALSNTSSSATVCSGTIFTYTPTSTTGGTTFTWTRATVTGITEPGTTGSPDINEALTNTSNAPIDVTYTIVATASGCSNPTGEDITLTVNPSPKLNSSLTPAAICSGELFTYSPTSASLDSTFTWTRATVTGITEPGTAGVNNISEILTNTTSSPIDVKYHYVTTSGNCSVGGAGDSVTVTVNPNATIGLTSAVGTDSQSVCVNTPIINITYNVGGSGINAAATGLPPGVNGIFNAGVFTISGTPNVSGIFNFTVNTSGICVQDTTTGTIVVGISLISTPGTNDQSVCLNTPIANIDYSIGGAGQSATVAGLPNGVSGVFSAGVFTISGTPTVVGGFDYTVSTTGSCAVTSVTGTINVGLSLISAIGTDSQSVCLNEAIINIIYRTVGGDIPPPIVTGLPNGVTGSLTSPGIFTITGTPVIEGFFTYTLTAQGTCASPASLTGTILVGLGRVSLAGTDSQKVCRNTPILPIDYTYRGGTPPVVVGLPGGVSGAVNLGRFTISGTPTIEGTFNYTVSAQGTCASPAQLTGRIIVGVGLISNPGTDSQSVCKNSPITSIVYYIVGGNTPAPNITGLPPGVTGTTTGADMFTITGTPSVDGTYNYTITSQGTCSTPSSLTGRIIVGVGLTSTPGTDSQSVCKNSPITSIVYYIVGGNTPAPNITGLPPGVTGTTTGADMFTITGTPSVDGTYNYTITSQGTCSTPSSLTGRIVVGGGLISPPGTDDQHVCLNSPITPIVYSLAGGDIPPPTVAGLPSNFTTGISNGIFTITGTPSVAGLISYTISAQGSCASSSTLSGKIVVGIGLTSATGTDTAQVVCKNTSAITPIVYSIVGGGINTVTGLPPGVTGTTTTPGDPAIFTISGTPTAAGTYNYLLTSTGGVCAPTGVSGRIKVNETTITPSSAPGTTNQTICSNTAITNVTYVIGGEGTGATVATLPPGLTGTYNAGVLTISGTPNAQVQPGTYTYTVTTTGVCTQSSSVFTLTILNPIANFSADTLIGVSPLLVNFTNESQNANIYSWDLGNDSLVSGVENPSNGYITPGTYTVILTASKDGLCPDTARAIVIIKENFSIIIPNVFTPNGDNVNDFFTILNTDVEILDVEIFDRWGLKLFEYHTIYGSWDGRSSKTNVACTDGTYYYIIYAKGYNGSEVKKTGAFTLIR